mmetsp:Transcript_24659/g.84412  ORF Transcript_24659/g.84412 Transcript_24659/m.84412 type:complete len:290 (+) Transcript_24659:776-1645(+)
MALLDVATTTRFAQKGARNEKGEGRTHVAKRERAVVVVADALRAFPGGSIGHRRRAAAAVEDVQLPRRRRVTAVRRVGPEAARPNQPEEQLVRPGGLVRDARHGLRRPRQNGARRSAAPDGGGESLLGAVEGGLLDGLVVEAGGDEELERVRLRHFVRVVPEPPRAALELEEAEPRVLRLGVVDGPAVDGRVCGLCGKGEAFLEAKRLGLLWRHGGEGKVLHAVLQRLDEGRLCFKVHGDSAAVAAVEPNLAAGLALLDEADAAVRDAHVCERALRGAALAARFVGVAA